MSEHPDEPAVDPSPDRPLGQSSEQAGQEERVESRSELLPEERAAGSEDPLEQAEAILAESDERTEDPVGTQQESVQSPDVDAGVDRGSPAGGSPAQDSSS
jgi:hypothetical protein